ncbi:hypothetical protein BJ684DRAFT_17068 [Piptocephalis cylindrospora]|uniref:Uncharacterized protein n=1 Tax=Piptocephalis cylindrospora TaxID=1907219 RepID=A0A4P9Y117_9FUNG|nr:hypothetical protein BJ684DRAFT_17068 [Piptocephalis cylindrospora]|eukprot:RKP12443.1 hypothetical protein BJ684DRAFT_17068 [Piptocephalis cylindrospora]
MDAEKSWAGAQRELTALRRRSMAKHDATAYLRSQLAAADETVRLREREAEEAEVRVQTLLAHLEGTSPDSHKVRDLSDRLSYLTVENQRLKQTISQSGDGTVPEGMEHMGSSSSHDGLDYMCSTSLLVGGDGYYTRNVIEEEGENGDERLEGMKRVGGSREGIRRVCIRMLLGHNVELHMK